MKQYSKNPRKIDPDELNHLTESLKKFGDLGVITHDLDTDEIISGNQRAKAIDINKQKIKILMEFNEPQEDGTLKIGMFKWKGAIFMYRAAKFKSDEDREQANIQANKLGGQFVFEDLMKNFKYENLLKYGFKEFELEPYRLSIDENLPNVDLLGVISNRAHYIILQFDTEDEIKSFREKFGMKMKEIKLSWIKLKKAICVE